MGIDERNMLEETLEEKGLTSYTLKSNPRIVLNFPKKYGIEQKYFNRSHIKKEKDPRLNDLLEDRTYISGCINLAYQDVKSKLGEEKKKAEFVYRYLKRALRNLGADKEEED
ncbi:MAG: hypothetical protein ACP5NZ_04370 [Nanobdellota archaeon]